MQPRLQVVGVGLLVMTLILLFVGWQQYQANAGSVAPAQSAHRALIRGGRGPDLLAGIKLAAPTNSDVRQRSHACYGNGKSRHAD